MLNLYHHPSPNPLKVALYLGEAGLANELMLIDTRKGEQHLPASMTNNPNAKLPVLVDGHAVVFDSNSILLYLVEKTVWFQLANTPANRAQLHS